MEWLRWNENTSVSPLPFTRIAIFFHPFAESTLIDLFCKRRIVRKVFPSPVACRAQLKLWIIIKGKLVSICISHQFFLSSSDFNAKKILIGIERYKIAGIDVRIDGYHFVSWWDSWCCTYELCLRVRTISLQLEPISTIFFSSSCDWMNRMQTQPHRQKRQYHTV